MPLVSRGDVDDVVIPGDAFADALYICMIDYCALSGT
jgi:hypothetical protein